MFESCVTSGFLFDCFAFCFGCFFCESNELSSGNAVFGYVDNNRKGKRVSEWMQWVILTIFLIP